MTGIATLREKAERHIVYPLNRDECLALIEIVEQACLVRNVARRGMGYGWRKFNSLVADLDRGVTAADIATLRSLL